MIFPDVMAFIENHSPSLEKTNPIDKFCDIVRLNRMVLKK